MEEKWMVPWVKAGEGRRRNSKMVLNVKTLKTGFAIAYVIRPGPCKYPDASLLSSTFPRPGSDLILCSSASPRGSRRGRGIPLPLYMLCCLLECSPSCPLICPLVIINTTFTLRIAQVTLLSALYATILCLPFPASRMVSLGLGEVKLPAKGRLG